MTLYNEAATGVLTRTALASYLENYGINDLSYESGDGTVGFPPLAVAACNGHIEVVKLLLDSGADADALSTDYQTPLWTMTASGLGGSNRAEIVDLLLKHKANARHSYPNLSDGAKPLENELKNLKDPEVIQLLIEENGITREAEKLAAALNNSEINDAMISTRQRRKFRTAAVNLLSAFLIFILTLVDNAAITKMLHKVFMKSLAYDNDNSVTHSVEKPKTTTNTLDLAIVGSN